jgi:phosphoglycolate phosphatase
MDKKVIIWDWNGTLLDDVQYSVDTINFLLKKYGLRQLSVQEYRKKFTFPVIDYYRAIGFDFAKVPFEKVGLEFIELYNKNLHSCKLRAGAIEALEELKKRGFEQVIISAREQASLIKDVALYQISDYFSAILGINNNFAAGKKYLIESYLKKNNVDSEYCYLIGDTEHDCQIAAEFGLNFIRIRNGHQDDVYFADYQEFAVVNDFDELMRKL